jgi:hypothetical protein
VAAGHDGGSSAVDLEHEAELGELLVAERNGAAV